MIFSTGYYYLYPLRTPSSVSATADSPEPAIHRGWRCCQHSSHLATSLWFCLYSVEGVGIKARPAFTEAWASLTFWYLLAFHLVTKVAEMGLVPREHYFYGIWFQIVTYRMSKFMVYFLFYINHLCISRHQVVGHLPVTKKVHVLYQLFYY